MTRSHLHLRAWPGRRDELLRDLDRLELLVVMSDQPGLLRVEALVAEDDPDQVLVDASWSSQELFERWQSSDMRENVLSSLGGLLAAEPEERTYRLADTFA
jgi:quinol monooxygenase YgiN